MTRIAAVTYVGPVLFALFAWWFSTGAVIYLDNLPRRTFRWSMLAATIVLLAALLGLAASAADTSVFGAYASFSCGLLIWAWQEISFYTGYVTGPRKHACREGCSGFAHFGHALQASLYHELAIVATAAVIVASTYGTPNQTGTWTFMVLWWMHESARLNVFLGVRNLNAEFLPEHLRYLKSFFVKKSMNLLFPVSVSVSLVAATLLTQAALAADAGPPLAAGYTFLSTLMILAILEHWFLVLPLPSAALWTWSLKSRASREALAPHIEAQNPAAPAAHCSTHIEVAGKAAPAIGYHDRSSL